MSKSQKMINFDLDTKELEKYYPTDNWRNAYYDIKAFMKENGFEWQQGSSYVSKERLDYTEVKDLIKDLVEENPYLNKCIRDCRMTNVSSRAYSLNAEYDKSVDLKTREELKQEKLKDNALKRRLKLNRQKSL